MIPRDSETPLKGEVAHDIFALWPYQGPPPIADTDVTTSDSTTPAADKK